MFPSQTNERWWSLTERVACQISDDSWQTVARAPCTGSEMRASSFCHLLRNRLRSNRAGSRVTCGRSTWFSLVTYNRVCHPAGREFRAERTTLLSLNSSSQLSL